MGNIDDNMEKMKAELKNMEDKNKSESEKLNRRLSLLEEDMRRMKYTKLKSPPRNNAPENGMTVLPVQPAQENQGKEIQGVLNQPEGKSRKDYQPVDKFNDQLGGRMGTKDRQESSAGPSQGQNGRDVEQDFHPLQSSWEGERNMEQQMLQTKAKLTELEIGREDA